MKAPDGLDLDEIDNDKIEQNQQEDAANQPRTDRSHENALRGHHTHNQDIQQRARQQPSARPAAPEMPPLAHQVDSCLAIKDQHHEDQRLQLGQGKLKLAACPEEDPE